jgi:hypothetical protein
VSFVEKMRASQAEAAQPVDPWRLRLERVRGEIGLDNLERISSQKLLDILEVQQRKRTAGAYRQLAKVMAELGWTAVRVRDLTRGGYKEQVRGYVRDARAVQRATIIRLLPSHGTRRTSRARLQT